MPVLGSGLQRDLPLAMQYAKNAIEIAPENPGNLQLAGIVAYRQRDYHQSLSYFKEAMANLKMKKPLSDLDRQMKNILKMLTLFTI